MDHKLSELCRYWSEMEQTGQPPSVTPRISKSAFQSYPLEQGQRAMTLPNRLPSQQGQRSQPMPFGSRTSLGPPARGDSLNRKDIPKRIKKGPISKHDSDRRRSGEPRKGQRSRHSDQSDAVLANGHSANEPQVKSEAYGTMSEPHVSQSYYPRSEDFTRHVPDYSYHIPSQQGRSASPQAGPAATYPSHPGQQDQSHLEEQIIQPDFYPSVQSQYEAQPHYENTPFTSQDDRQQYAPPTESFTKIEPEVTKLQSQPNLTAVGKSDMPETKHSSKYMIPDTLPITKSTPDLSKPPPPKVDIMPKFHLPRRADSPPKSFQELLTKFQTGETTEKPGETREKQEVQKEIDRVLKSRASYLDEEQKVLDKRRPPDLKQEMEEVGSILTFSNQCDFCLVTWFCRRTVPVFHQYTITNN